MQVDLGSRATLVILSISQWYGKRVDAKGTRAVAQSLQVDTKDDAYIKRLVPRSALSNITALISQVRSYHYDETLAWGDGGIRILPGKNFFAYAQQMSLFKSRLENMVEAFLQSYPQLVAEAQIYKGNMFDASEYPEAAVIRSAFAMTTTFMPFPNAADFRLEIDDDLRTQLVAETRREYQAKIDGAMASLYGKFVDLLKEWDEVLTADKWRASLLDRLKLLCEIAPAQNLLDDAGIEELIKDCEVLAKQTRVIAPELKSFSSARKLLKDEARELMTKHGMRDPVKEAA